MTNSRIRNVDIVVIVMRLVAIGCILVVDKALYTIAPKIISRNIAMTKPIILSISNNIVLETTKCK